MQDSVFDPNGPAKLTSGIFGLPYNEEESKLVYLPVPWEATTSYGGGTSNGPEAILNASRQVDLFDLEVHRPYEAGIYMLPESHEVRKWNEEGKFLAQKIIQNLVAEHVAHSQDMAHALIRVNELGEQLNHYVYQETKRLLSAGKLVGVVGGDHSVPFGALKAISEKYASFGILHIDAHSDTRNAYEGFEWSHGSIMHNVIEKIPNIKQLVQVGIRDVGEDEIEYITQTKKSQITCFFDRILASKKMEGATWGELCKPMIQALPDSVWISIDIDGLDPQFCPHTGTPVPGGLSYQEVLYLIAQVYHSGKKIIGFDLNEVAPHPTDPTDEWDANVAARILYKLSAWTLASQGKVKLHTI